MISRLIVALLMTSLIAVAAEPTGERIRFEAGGLQRTAVVVRPAHSTAKVPLVLLFHGHGGDGRDFAGRVEFHRAWPGTICIYPDGLPAPGERDPEGRRPGWQKKLGDLNDRDLALFDTLVEKAVKSYGADPQRVYAAGFSNGAVFTNLLWSVRAEKLRATASAGGECLTGEMWRRFVSKPAVAMHGHDDGRVPPNIALQSINAMLGANQSIEKLSGWPPGRTIKTYAPKPGGQETLIITHTGGHLWPDWATPHVVGFFKAH